MKFIYTLLLTIACTSNYIVAQGVQVNNAPTVFCPLMEVNVDKTGHQSYTISYCNHGNRISAGTYIELSISNNAQIVSSELNYRAKSLNVYRIDLGTVGVGVCHNFDIILDVSFNDNGCLDIKIYPDNPCQAMIDKYILDNGGLVSTGTTTGGTSTGGGGTTTTISSISSQRSTDFLARPVPVSSVFEDNVMLNNIPIWDSLDRNNGGSGNMTISTNGNGTVSGGHVSATNEPIDIQGLSVADYCATITAATGTPNTTATTVNAGIDLGDSRTVQGGGHGVNPVANTVSDPTTNFNNLEEKIMVQVYPNPFDNYTTIEIQGNIPTSIKLQLIDVTGRVVRNQQITEQKSITLYKENLAAGMYFYRLESDAKVLNTGKLIVR